MPIFSRDEIIAISVYNEHFTEGFRAVNRGYGPLLVLSRADSITTSVAHPGTILGEVKEHQPDRLKYMDCIKMETARTCTNSIAL